MGHTDIVDLLCSRGASVHLALKDMTTPLFVASQNGYLDVVRVLERHRADVNSRRVVCCSSMFCPINVIAVGKVKYNSQTGFETLFKTKRSSFYTL